jgi:hypothetical protein
MVLTPLATVEHVANSLAIAALKFSEAMFLYASHENYRVESMLTAQGLLETINADFTLLLTKHQGPRS